MSQYKIMKLRSGETIISQITNSTKHSLTLHRPMEVHFPQFVDPFGNSKKGRPCMKNYLAGSETADITIPSDFVAAFLPPTREMVFLYENQKKIEDNPSLATDHTEREDLPPLGDTASMLEQLFGTKSDKKEENQKEDPNQISVRIKIPPAIWMHMLASGILDSVEDEDWTPPDDRGDDFGTDYEDWSPNPEDY